MAGVMKRKTATGIEAGVGPADHGALGGLADDDHTQYALADGTRGSFVKTAGGDTITASGAAVKPLVLKGAASQTANLQDWQNSAGTAMAFIETSGTFRTENRISAGTKTHIGGILQSQATSAGEIGLVVRGAASQTANLAEFHNSAGTVLANIDNGGGIQQPGEVRNAFGGASIGDTTTAIYATVPATRPLIVKGAASQTAHLTEWQNSAATVLAGVSNTGHIGAGTAPWSGTVFYGLATGADVRGLMVRGVASQTANLIEVQNNGGTVVGGFSPTGQLIFDNGQATATATAGTNGGLPAQVAGYMTVKDQTGVVRKIPYYNN